jgi:hypothetical protein
MNYHSITDLHLKGQKLAEAIDRYEEGKRVTTETILLMSLVLRQGLVLTCSMDGLTHYVTIESQHGRRTTGIADSFGDALRMAPGYGG